MYPDPICTSIRKLPGLIVRFTFAALLTVPALYTESSALALASPGHETLLSPTMLASIAGSAEYNATIVKDDIRNQDPEGVKPVFANSTSARAGAATAQPVEADTYESLASKSVVDNRTPDWNGVWRDTGIFFGAQIVAASITLMAPESVSGWSSEDKKNSFKKYGNNFVRPVFDNDAFYINYILHPYWGATYYTRARERGLDKSSSFFYSTLISTLYEFGAECFYEKPSIQDLIVTPVAGSIVGAYLFEPWRESIKRKKELSWYDHAALIVTDPVGVLSLGFEKLFGLKPTIMINYPVPQLKASSGSVSVLRSNSIGVVMQFPLQ